MTSRIRIALMLLSLALSSVQAASYTAKELYPLCKYNTPQSNIQLCYGYISGVSDEWVDKMHWRNSLCPQPALKITAEFVRDVFLKFMKKKPGLFHQPANRVIKQSLLSRYGCQRE